MMAPVGHFSRGLCQPGGNRIRGKQEQVLALHKGLSENILPKVWRTSAIKNRQAA